MKYTSAILSAASGSVGGLTFSHNKGGSYCRARAMPTNRRSIAQERMRAILGSLANRWATMTNIQRASWAAYADNVLITNTLGASRKISALDHFIRSNAIRLRVFGYAYLALDAPTIYNIGATPIITAVTCVMDSLGVAQFACTAYVSDAAVIAEPMTRLIFFMSRPKDATNLARNGIFNYCDAVAIAEFASQPQACTVAASLGYDGGGGQRMDYEVAVSREDGRYSARGKGSVIVSPYVP